MVQGTKGLFQGYPNRVYIEGRGRADQWQQASDVLAEFEHPLWKEIAAAAPGAGHGGMDFIEDYRLIKCLREGTADRHERVRRRGVERGRALERQVGRQAQPAVDFPTSREADGRRRHRSASSTCNAARGTVDGQRIAQRLVERGLDASSPRGPPQSSTRRSPRVAVAHGMLRSTPGGCPDGSRCSASTPTTPAAARSWRRSPRGFAFVAAPRADASVRIVDGLNGEQVGLDPSPAQGPEPTGAESPSPRTGLLRMAALRRGRGGPTRPQLPRCPSRRRYRLREQSPPGLRHEQLERASRGPGNRARRGSRASRA